jgi:hypothetical protein
MQKPIDTIQIGVADFHSGSNYALFLDRKWEGKNTSHYPRSAQIEIRKRFEIFAAEIKKRRKDKRVIIVHNGDSIEGDHHHSGDVCTINPIEQADIHIELMSEFQKRIGWRAGDKIYYTRGTQVHVGEFENYIGEQMNAVPCGDNYVHNKLALETNGVLSWFVHHGPGAGVGANEGNALRNWMRGIYYDCLKDGSRVPDIIYSGHVHNPTYTPLGIRLRCFEFKNMHAVILPSWQNKTAYAWQKAPVQKNKIGGVIHEIKSDGTICIPVFSVSENDC